MANNNSSSDVLAAVEGANKMKGEQSMVVWLGDKSLGTAANLSKLLPTGTTLAFQTMAPSFTKGGECTGHDVNFCFTWGLIAFLTLLCGILSFTDSVTDRDGHTYYGVATRYGFKLFNHHLSELSLFDDEVERDKEKRAKRLQELRERKKWKPRDFMHAIVSSAVFVALAFCDAGVQSCLVPPNPKSNKVNQWKQFLNNLPLAVGFVAGFLFMIFPSTRNGIGDDGPATTGPNTIQPATTNAGDSTSSTVNIHQLPASV